MTKKAINVIDLFAGCGGLADGFESSGFFQTVGCVEWDVKCCETLSKRLQNKWGYNDAESRVLCHDIQDFDGVLSKINGKEKIDVIVGGPPCQAYSIAGRIRDEKGMHDDYRNYLFESYIKIVDHYNPKFFVFENVPGILSATPNGVNIVHEIRKQFKSIGYIIPDDLKSYGLLDASDYGVPQKRKRIIIIGIRDDLFYENVFEDFYKDFLARFIVKSKTTVQEAIGDLPKILPLSNHQGRQSHEISIKNFSIQGHTGRYHSARDIKIFKELAYDKLTGKHKYKSTASLKELYERVTGKKSNVHKYNVLEYNNQSNTIVAHLHKDGLRHIHPDPDQARSITVREAARLQSFDDDFVFLGSQGDQYKMIGNAVPPLFAKAIAMACSILYSKLTKGQ